MTLLLIFQVYKTLSFCGSVNARSVEAVNAAELRQYVIANILYFKHAYI